MVKRGQGEHAAGAAFAALLQAKLVSPRGENCDARCPRRELVQLGKQLVVRLGRQNPPDVAKRCLRLFVGQFAPPGFPQHDGCLSLLGMQRPQGVFDDFGILRDQSGSQGVGTIGPGKLDGGLDQPQTKAARLRSQHFV